MADSSATPSEGTFTGREKFIRFSSRTGKCRQPARTPWLSRRHTPYVKTPKTGRTSRIQTTDNVRSLKRRTNKTVTPQNFERSLPSDSRTEPPETQTKHVFQDVIGKTLRLFQASPLFKFDASRSALRTYADQLSACMQLETEKQLVVETNGGIKDRKYKTDICSFKEVSADDAKFSAVKITVESFNPKPRQASSNFNHILTAMFCSVGTDDSEDIKLQHHFTSLPICLIKAPVELARIMISWFEQKFDCRITPMTFSSMNLGWYFSLWAGISPYGKSVPIELCYNASSVNGLGRILFSIEQKDAKIIWDKIHGGNSLVFTEEESRTFLKALKCHFYHHFRVNLEGLPITRVRTAVACIASEGKLKIVHPHYVDHVLEQLTRAASTKVFYGRL